MKNVDITFNVQGHITQKVELTNPDYTPEQVQELLNEGKALTTIQKGGDICLYTEDGDEIVLGKVVAVEPTENLQYDEFEVEVQDEGSAPESA
jgi:hypothetical protein